MTILTFTFALNSRIREVEREIVYVMIQEGLKNEFKQNLYSSYMRIRMDSRIYLSKDFKFDFQMFP